MSLLDPPFWDGLLKIVVANILLSGDNAVVIALACRSLPARYRTRAAIAGGAGAVAVRVAFCAIVAWLMVLPAIKLIGGLMLLWIGVKLMVPEDEAAAGVAGVAGLWSAIRTIIVADLVMSLDNVIAIVAAAHGDVALIVIGLVLSVPLIVLGSGVLMRLLDRFPLLVTLGAGLLGWLGGDIMTGDPLVASWIGSMGIAAEDGHWIARAAAIGGAALVVAAGTMLSRRAAARARRLEDLSAQEPQ